VRSAALIVCFVLLVPALARAERPSARCSAVQQGRRTLAGVQLAHFFDRELLRLIRLGLEGHITVRLTLMRRRTAWFDDVVLTVEQDLVVTWDKDERIYRINDVPIDAAALDPLAFERISLGRRDGNIAGTHYLEVSVELQVVTVKSLLHAAGWVAGGSPARADVVSTRVARAVVEDLTKKARTSCEVTSKR
jgi:hypothetical protein